MKPWLGPFALSVVVAVSSACGDTGADATVRVFAAASLTDSFAVIESAFEAEHPGVDVQLNLAGSSTLREQLIAGAPGDVFASADQSNMAAVLAEGAGAGSPLVFARNRLQIAVPAGNPGSVIDLASLADDDLLVGLCAAGVPCGDLARAVLAEAGIEPAIDTNEPDVRALLTKLIAGELDAGVVYASDVVAAGDSIEGIAIADHLNRSADYPIVALAQAGDPERAAGFIEFVVSDRGRAILIDHGFEAP